MLTSGDIIELDLGAPSGREAGFRHPAVVLTAQRILEREPNVIQIVPLTTKTRGFGSEVLIEPDESNGLVRPSSAQCQHIRAVATSRIEGVVGNVGSVTLSQIREIVGLILDLRT